MSTETVTPDETDVGVDTERVALYAVLGGLVVFYLLPIETGLMTSLKANPFSSAPFLPPVEGFTAAKYGRAFDALGHGFVNSFLLTIPATVLSALLGSMATTSFGIGVLVLAVLSVLGQFGVLTAISIMYSFLASLLVLPSALVVWDRVINDDPSAPMGPKPGTDPGSAQGIDPVPDGGTRDPERTDGGARIES